MNFTVSGMWILSRPREAVRRGLGKVLGIGGTRFPNLCSPYPWTPEARRAHGKKLSLDKIPKVR